MTLTETPIAGAWLLEIQPISDERGFFARSLCVDTLAAHGLEGRMQQQSVSFNQRRGTLRGMHYEAAPHEEAKLVRVVRGRIFDVAVDLRPDSPTYRRWTGTELSAANGRALLIGKGMAHGFVTLEDDTDVLYQIDKIFEPGHGRGVRWNDPAFAIAWPVSPVVISERDATYPDLGA